MHESARWPWDTVSVKVCVLTPDLFLAVRVIV
jgi:hypothetical protein